MSKVINSGDVANARFLVGLPGGNVSCISPDGEVRWQVGYSGGIHFTDQLVNFMFPGDELQLEGAISLVSRRGTVIAQTFGEEAMRTGANPDFRPTAATQAEMEIRRKIQQLNSLNKTAEKQVKAFAAILEAKAKAEQLGVIDSEAQTAKAPEKPKEGQQGGKSPEGVQVQPEGEVSS